MRNLFSIAFLLISFGIFAQKEAANWYFGQNAGIDFNSGFPVVLNNGFISAPEGCATVSDSDGNLLFYTNGLIVRDRNHNIMPNGNDLLGDPSTAQSSIIVPKPDNPNIYYIFTIDDLGGEFGFRYSEVDLLLNGGNGDVTTNKNILLYTPVAEKLTAVKNESGNGYWVIVHSTIPSTDFLAYEVNTSGVSSTSVQSTIGSVIQSVFSMVGYMKASPNGEKLAIAAAGVNSFVEIYDFNSETGVVSNPILLNNIFYDNPGVYGLEFSPNSKRLYVSDGDPLSNNSKVHQFNLELGLANKIVNSDQIIYSGRNAILGIQLAIDEKIYLANRSANFLDVISRPNFLGSDSNYQNQVVSLGTNNIGAGLPAIVQSLLLADFEVDFFCLGDSTQFDLNGEDVISVTWDFGDGNTSSDISPNHIYANSGFYNVSATIITSSNFRTVSKEIEIFEVPIAFPVSNYVLCDDDTNDGIEIFDLSIKNTEVLGSQSPSSYNIAYFESLNDADFHINEMPLLYENTSNGQEIFAKIFNNQNRYCYDIVSFNLIVDVRPVANVVEDFISCLEDVNSDLSIDINLRQFDALVLGSQIPLEFNISYHLSQNDADLNANGLPDIYTTISNPEQIFIRIENNNNLNCFDTSSFTIISYEQPNAFIPEDMIVCDAENNDGFETFDLLQQNLLILNGQIDMSISYHLNQIDADTNQNPISLSYTNTTNPELIFARVESDFSTVCFDTISFFIEVKEKPNLDIVDVWYICKNETVTLIVDSGFDSYLWSTGETTQSIVVDSPGNYNVMVENHYNTNPQISCSTTKTLEVIASDVALVYKIKIEDWSANDNSIEVFVSGIGNYEFSIDGVNFQDSSVFHGLSVGEYNIFVRDKNGCGIAIEDVYILFYPKVFTPNGDGVNDYWQVFYANSEPDLRVSIFDRYGKFIKALNANDIGWDGSLNGKLLPNSDYWFVVTRPQKEIIYRGHFSLKR